MPDGGSRVPEAEQAYRCGSARVCVCGGGGDCGVEAVEVSQTTPHRCCAGRAAALHANTLHTTCSPAQGRPGAGQPQRCHSSGLHPGELPVALP
jgi:hypothetical protein